jgi:hypothetical protein
MHLLFLDCAQIVQCWKEAHLWLNWSIIKDKVTTSQISSSPFSQASMKSLVLVLLLFYGAYGAREMSTFGSTNWSFQLPFVDLQ